MRIPCAVARAPSLLPGWSRGHVITHLARNADGLGRLLDWGATGVPQAQYPSQDARDADIESGAGRPAAALLADAREAAARWERSARAQFAEDALIDFFEGLEGGGRLGSGGQDSSGLDLHFLPNVT